MKPKYAGLIAKNYINQTDAKSNIGNTIKERFNVDNHCIHFNGMNPRVWSFLQRMGKQRI